MIKGLHIAGLPNAWGMVADLARMFSEHYKGQGYVQLLCR
ncbi:hypothetical protein FOXB_05060 [Fusarium oxysporum f. sp. conglutinans Fo5176]|uniref:Uncharacterized protein n=1 Tax=Fusarium oxysporum (strain Fo5176) TaxID=660025 RepID=F9FF81_FUSOF|nr:hypothetical protein FOXB_05060 [Fusarium oxysporum f. sp. conglutinans Fo5176]